MAEDSSSAISKKETEKINFTKPNIEALTLPPDGKRREVYDTKTNGLMIRITSAGTRTFYLRKRVKNGRSERIALGKFPDMTVEQARVEAKRLLADFAVGKNPMQERRERREEMTLQDLFNRYMEEHGNYRARPDKMYDTYRLYLSHWSKRKLSEILYTDVDRWHRRLPAEINKRRQNSERQFTPVTGQRTANIALALLRAMYQKAIDKRWWSGENPADGIDRFKASPHRPLNVVPLAARDA